MDEYTRRTMTESERDSLRAENARLKAEVDRLRYVIDSNAIDQGLEWKNDLFLTCYSASKDRDRIKKELEHREERFGKVWDSRKEIHEKYLAWKKVARLLVFGVEYHKYAYHIADEVDEAYDAAKALEGDDE